MTAQDKAKDLVDKFYTFNNTPTKVNNLFSKQCALILVNEILESNNILLKLDSIGIVFWEQVKKEIEKL